MDGLGIAGLLCLHAMVDVLKGETVRAILGSRAETIQRSPNFPFLPPARPKGTRAFKWVSGYAQDELCPDLAHLEFSSLLLCP